MTSLVRSQFLGVGPEIKIVVASWYDVNRAPEMVLICDNNTCRLQPHRHCSFNEAQLGSICEVRMKIELE
jgi:hypothetical protein